METVAIITNAYTPQVYRRTMKQLFNGGVERTICYGGFESSVLGKNWRWIADKSPAQQVLDARSDWAEKTLVLDGGTLYSNLIMSVMLATTKALHFFGQNGINTATKKLGAAIFAISFSNIMDYDIAKAIRELSDPELSDLLAPFRYKAEVTWAVDYSGRYTVGEMLEAAKEDDRKWSMQP